MRCPRCENTSTRVIDSRDLEGGSTIRRRRECEACEYRFTTYERPEGARLVVVKRDGSRQDFDREKLRPGMLTALQKRRSRSTVRDRARRLESHLLSRGDAELPRPRSAGWRPMRGRELDHLLTSVRSVDHSYDDIETLQR